MCVQYLAFHMALCFNAATPNSAFAPDFAFWRVEMEKVLIRQTPCPAESESCHYLIKGSAGSRSGATLVVYSTCYSKSLHLVPNTFGVRSQIQIGWKPPAFPVENERNKEKKYAVEKDLDEQTVKKGKKSHNADF